MKIKKKRPQVAVNGKRASFHRKLRQHDLREKISNANLLDQINRDIEKVAKLDKEIAELDPNVISAAFSRKLQGRLNAARIKLNARFRLLNKVLPDAKDSDFDSPYDDPPKLTLRIVR